MRPVCADTRWLRLSRFIAETMGLHFPRARWGDLQRGLAAASGELGFDDAGECVDWLLSSPPTESRLQVLAGHLTIGETYFFRDRQVMEAVAARVLAELIAARRGRDQRLRLWSAGCCTGEEPYSLAILLHQLLPDLDDWDVTITATDINAQFLDRAAAGVYGGWSFRDAPPGLRERYFTPTPDGRHAILPELGRLVRFRRLNLVGEDYPSPATGTQGMDLVFCRNVLMYFKPSQIDRVVGRLHRALVDGGWLVVSPSEACEALYPRFVTHNYPGAILYRRDDASRRAGRTGPPPPPARTIRPGRADEAGRFDEVAAPFVTPPPPHAAPAEGSRDLSPAGRNVPLGESTTVRPSGLAAAESLCREGRYREAAERLLAEVTEDTRDGAALSLLTRTLADLGRLDEALAWCARWIAADKLHAAPRYLHGVILLESGDVQGARRSLQRALYLDPGFVLAHYTLGNLARDAGDRESSRRHFANALRALQGCDPDAPVSESDGLSARRLAETIEQIARAEVRHGY